MKKTTVTLRLASSQGVKVTGYAVTIYDLPVFVHRRVNYPALYHATDERRWQAIRIYSSWTVSEPLTGMALTNRPCKTRKAALEACAKRLERWHSDNAKASLAGFIFKRAAELPDFSNIIDLTGVRHGQSYDPTQQR